jgi:hypothetical protein
MLLKYFYFCRNTYFFCSVGDLVYFALQALSILQHLKHIQRAAIVIILANEYAKYDIYIPPYFYLKACHPVDKFSIF